MASSRAVGMPICPSQGVRMPPRGRANRTEPSRGPERPYLPCAVSPAAHRRAFSDDVTEALNAFAETLTEDQVTNLANYFVTLPSEVAMKLWTVLGDTDNIDNVVALHKAEAADGRRVSDHLVEILGGNQS